MLDNFTCFIPIFDHEFFEFEITQIPDVHDHLKTEVFGSNLKSHVLQQLRQTMSRLKLKTITNVSAEVTIHRSSSK